MTGHIIAVIQVQGRASRAPCVVDIADLEFRVPPCP